MHVRQSPATEFIVATAAGTLHRLEQAAPEKSFYPASEDAACRYMKMIILDEVLHSPREEVHRFQIPAEIATRAAKPSAA